MRMRRKARTPATRFKELSLKIREPAASLCLDAAPLHRIPQAHFDLRCVCRPVTIPQPSSNSASRVEPRLLEFSLATQCLA